MNPFDQDTCLQAGQPDEWLGQISPAWNIGTHPNGGYLASIAARALSLALPQHPDPLSFTVHYLQPGMSGQDCQVRTQVLRSGRQLSTARATLIQQGSARVEVLAAFGRLEDAMSTALSFAPPEMPSPDRCVSRSPTSQGVPMPICDRLDIQLHPQQAEPGQAGDARVSGWIRFRDGREPDPLACLLFADAFPPPAFGLYGAVGWVPTVELTVHVRRRPAPGWMLGRFQTQDLTGGRLVEDGALWDSEGHLVAQSRQLALLRGVSPDG